MRAGAMASKRKRPRLAPLQADPTPERVAKAQGAIEFGDDEFGRKVMRVRDFPIEELLRRGNINSAEYSVGVKFRHHWYHSGLSELQSAEMCRVSVSIPDNWLGMPKTEEQAHHRQQYRKAVECMGRDAWVVVWLVCHEYPLSRTGMAMGAPYPADGIREATRALKRALGCLCGIWGM